MEKLKVYANHPLFKWFTLLLLGFVWGSSFILMKKSLVVYTPNEVAQLRLLVTAIAFLPITIYQFRVLIGKDFKWFFASGWMGNGIPAFLFTNAQTKIASSLAGMLNSLTPLFTMIVGILFFHIRPKKNKVFGVIIGFLGAVSLIWASKGIDVSGSLRAAGLVVLATIMYGMNANVLKSKLSHHHPVNITAFTFFITGFSWLPFLLWNSDVISFFTDESHRQAFLYIAILSLAGSGFSVVLFNVLVKKTSAIFASSVTYLIPVFAILWGLSDGETIQVFQFVSIGIILTGIYLVNRN
jgi:drug/metabolite transporter (DMT)-like permease